MLEGDFAAAARSLARARALLPRLPGDNHRGWLVHDEARLAYARGDLVAAERLFRRYIGDEIGGRFDVTRFDARVRLADIHVRRGDVARAEREMLLATDHIERWRASLDDAQTRTLALQAVASSGAASAEATESASRVARIFAALAQRGRHDVAFSIVERWRARELTDRLVRVSALRDHTTPATQSSAPASAPTRGAAEIAAAIPDERVAVLEFVAAEQAPITLFVMQRSGLQAIVLPLVDSLALTVARFNALVESGADAARLGRTLGAALIDAVLPKLDPRVTRLVIVPDGPLHRLPFDALRLSDGRYVAERFATGFAPSASLVAALWARAGRVTPRTSTRLLALGDPASPVPARGLNGDADGDEFLSAVRAAGGLPRLSGASREARLVARYAAEADVRVGSKASAAFLKQADLRGYSVLHFAAHGIIDEQSVAGTALALAPSAGESGFVGAGDLAALRLSADLVVLSACQSARGVVVSGEGVQGLTSPLLQAGARAVVATDWRILDKDAVQFVESLYEALARGLPVVEALRDAKLRAIATGKSPRTWAAFRAIGDPLVVVPLRVPPRRWWSALTAR
jgi:CHAT domain-containing protein